jgi:hypothetical protein
VPTLGQRLRQPTPIPPRILLHQSTNLADFGGANPAALNGLGFSHTDNMTGRKLGVPYKIEKSSRSLST